MAIPDSAAPIALLDPTGSESRTCRSFASVACIPALGTLTNVGMRGIVSPEVFERVSIMVSRLLRASSLMIDQNV